MPRSKQKAKAKQDKGIQNAAAAIIPVTQTEFVINESELNHFKGDMLSNSFRVKDILRAAFDGKNYQLIKSLGKYSLNTENIFFVICLLSSDPHGAEVIKDLLNSLKPTKLEQLRLHRAEDGWSLLHRVCVFNNRESVEALIEKKFDINSKIEIEEGYYGCTPLYLAVLHNNPAVAKILCDNGANPMLAPPPFQGAARASPMTVAVKIGDFDLLKALGANNETKQKAKYLPSEKRIKAHARPSILEKELTDVEIAEIEFLSGLFIKEGQAKRFNKFIELSMTILKSYKEESVASLLAFSSASASGSVIEPASAAGDSNSERKKWHCFLLGRLIDMSKFYKFLEDETLRDFIINMTEIINEAGLLAVLYNNLCLEALNISKSQAYTYGKRALSLNTEGAPLTKDLLGKIYYNIGLAANHYNDSSALAYFQEAERYLPKDTDVYFQQWLINLRCFQTEKALEIAQKIKGTFKEILVLRTMLVSGEMPLEIIEQEAAKLNVLESQKEYSSYLHLMIDISNKRGNLNEVLKYIDLDLLKDSTHANIQGAITTALHIFQEHNQLDKGLEYLEKTYAKYPNLANHAYLPLKYYEFLLHENKGNYELATIKLQEFDEIKLQGRYAHHLSQMAHRVRFYTEVERKDFTKAEFHLKLTTYDQAGMKALLDVLRNDEEEKDKLLKVSASSSAIDDREISNASVSENDTSMAEAMLEASMLTSNDDSLSASDITSLNDSAKDVREVAPQAALSGAAATKLEADYINDLSPDYLNPKTIHAYFQQKKKLALKEKSDDLAFKNTCASWQLPDGTKYNATQDSLYKLEGRENFYVLINEELKVDNKALEAFTRAVKKGLVSQQYHSNGVKFLDEERAELKINDDLRLWSNKLYCNTDGKYLVVFDRCGKHKAVERATRIKIKVIGVGIDKDFHPKSKSMFSSEITHLDENKEEVSIDDMLKYHDLNEVPTSTSALIGCASGDLGLEDDISGWKI